MIQYGITSSLARAEAAKLLGASFVNDRVRVAIVQRGRIAGPISAEVTGRSDGATALHSQRVGLLVRTDELNPRDADASDYNTLQKLPLEFVNRPGGVIITVREHDGASEPRPAPGPDAWVVYVLPPMEQRDGDWYMRPLTPDDLAARRSDPEPDYTTLPRPYAWLLAQAHALEAEAFKYEAGSAVHTKLRVAATSLRESIGNVIEGAGLIVSRVPPVDPKAGF